MYFVLIFALFCWQPRSFAHGKNKSPFQILHREHSIEKRQIDNSDSPGDHSNTETVNHDYYTSRVISDPEGHYWNELENHTRHHLSNDFHLKYSFVTISFNFSFYGHLINKFALTTQGFLYMSTFEHDELDYSHSRYIAPLMGNFDTIGNSSDILYKDNGNSYVVEWRNVQLNNQTQNGEYTFQVTLFENGTIWFGYKSIPSTDISSTVWPVKIGVADAFYLDQRNPFTGGWFRWIVRYHTVKKNVTELTDNMVIILDPLPTCNKISDCEQCVTADISFDCSWCPVVSRCSDSLDWYRQEWLQKGCENDAINTSAACSIETTKNPTTTTTIPTTTSNPSTLSITTKPATVTTKPATTTMKPTTMGQTSPTSQMLTSTEIPQDSTTGTHNSPKVGAQTSKKDKTSAAAIVAIVVIIVAFVVIILAWIIYARTHPTSSSGLWLIENRPSQLKEKIRKRFSDIHLPKNSETGDRVQMS